MNNDKLSAPKSSTGRDPERLGLGASAPDIPESGSPNPSAFNPARDQVELLRRAFPKIAGGAEGRGICAWCGGNRALAHALCRKDWATLDAKDRAVYLSLDIFGRASWILANKPGASAGEIADAMVRSNDG